MHIHPSSPNSDTSFQTEESAAIKIQAGFRGYNMRKQLTGCSEPESASVEDRCATKIQAGVRGYLVRKKQKVAADAATKIQAGFRGFKVRKEVQKNMQK